MVENTKNGVENSFGAIRSESMGVMIPLWYAVCLCLAAAYFGFWFGRSRNWGMIERIQAESVEGDENLESGWTGSEDSEEGWVRSDPPQKSRAGSNGRKNRTEAGTLMGRTEAAGSGGRTRGTAASEGRTGGTVGAERRLDPRGGDKYYGKNLFCPTGGKAAGCQEGGLSGVRILTTESRLYSPASGRVLKISPRCNAFQIRTDWGEDVTVRACTTEDDLLDRYFRPRVVRGEIVRRGRLLLEYDRETLCRKCQDTAVYVTVGGEQEGELEIEEDLPVKVGDCIRWLHSEDLS